MDASDELYCSKISVLDSYQNEVPAPPLHGNGLTDITLDVIIIEAFGKEISNKEGRINVNFCSGSKLGGGNFNNEATV